MNQYLYDTMLPADEEQPTEYERRAAALREADSEDEEQVILYTHNV